MGGTAGGTANPACPKPTGQICHEFFANDNSRNQILYVNEFTTKGWTKKVGDTGQNSPRALQLVDNAKGKTGKAVLVSVDKGFVEFDVVDGTELTRVATSSAVTSAIRIPNDGISKLPPGTTVLARDTNPTELAFVGPTGAAAATAIKLTFAAAGVELRKLERNPTTGNFSFTKYESASAAYIYEVTEQGSLVAKIRLPPNAKGYNAVWIGGGKMQATTGSNASVITIDTAGVVSATVGGPNKVKDAAGVTVFTDFFSGFTVLPNSNVVAANWLGHVDATKYANTPELLELTPAGTLAWSWGNQTLATWITYALFVH